MASLIEVSKRWFADNRLLFKYPPYLETEESGLLAVKFEGINPSIALYISKSGQATATIETASEEVDPQGIDDIVFEEDLIWAQQPNGQFYCRMCLTPVYFRTLEALWIQHTLIEVPIWVNRFTEEDCYCFWGRLEQGSWGAELVKKRDAGNRKYSSCHPVVLE